MPKVFISHSTADRDFVEREIIAPLRQAGIETWYSKEDIRPKNLWDREIVNALKDCDWFLLVMSPRSEKSEWVRSELHWAMDHRFGRIVPVLIEQCDPYDFHLHLTRIQHIDFRRERAQAKTTLIRTFPGVSPPSPPKPKASPARPAPSPVAGQPERGVSGNRPGTAAARDDAVSQLAARMRVPGDRLVAAPSPKPVAPPPAPTPPGRPPRLPKIALAASCGGLLLLGIVIYVTTDKGQVKIDLGELKTPVSPFTKMKLALIPAGSFQMGSPEEDKDASSNEKPRHRVTVSRPFYLGVYEVTQGEYERVMGANPSHFKGTDTLPVETVSWFDAVKFCNALSEKDGRRPYYKIEDQTVTILGGTGYRLPTEAEWEYACRAPQGTGRVTKHPFGDDDADLKSYAWFSGNSESKPHPVGHKKPNRWGLYDMQGNVWEWCQDWYSAGYYSSPPATDPPGPATASCRVGRGGGWSLAPRFCRPAYRSWSTPDIRSDNLGFRLASDQS